MLTLSCTETPERVTIRVIGELAIDTVETFDTTTARWLGTDRTIDLECGLLSFVDSTGVNSLMKAVLRWQAAGVPVEISNLSIDLKEMLDVLGFFEVVGGQA